MISPGKILFWPGLIASAGFVDQQRKRCRRLLSGLEAPAWYFCSRLVSSL
jgi:hypothetical protein